MERRERMNNGYPYYGDEGFYDDHGMSDVEEESDDDTEINALNMLLEVVFEPDQGFIDFSRIYHFWAFNNAYVEPDNYRFMNIHHGGPYQVPLQDLNQNQQEAQGSNEGDKAEGAAAANPPANDQPAADEEVKENEVEGEKGDSGEEK